MKRNAERLLNQGTPAASMLQETPFDNLCLTSQAVLERAQKQGRSKCPRCHSSRMFYCYSCYVPVETVPVEDIPIVKLPLKIDIIKHPNETDGKSTAVHAKLLASEDVTIYTYPCIPNYEEMQHEVRVWLLQIELKSRKTSFWRHQKGKPETYLSTIEAIYYFLVDYHKEVLKEKYDGQYDNLLFFFSFMYKLIRKAKDSAGKK
ncbi:hypothetical protein Chor_001332 [Crotalus horridus]